MGFFDRARKSIVRAPRDQGGGASIEFALLVPIALLMFAGVFEVGGMLFMSAAMEGSVRDAARFGITGYTPGAQSREDHILEIIDQGTMGMMDMNNVQVTQKIYDSFGDIGQPEPFTDQTPFNGTYDVGEPYSDINGNGQWDEDMGTAGVGGPGDIVVYTVTYDWPLMTPLLEHLLGENGKVALSASIAVRNEPYGTVPPPLGG